MRIGVISDTHNLLRPEAVSYLQGCDHIVHAGDVCGAQVLADLRTIAPLTAVRGNNDRGAWAEALPSTELVELGGVYLYVVHDLADLDIDPQGAGVQVVVSGHSHEPCITYRDGVIFLNPGSAGPRRFNLPVALGEIIVACGEVSASTFTLAV